MQNIKKASFIIILTTLISRITGFIKEILIANYFGTSIFADIIIIATRLPNLFRKIFGEGAMSQVFIPIYCNLKAATQIIFLHKIFILLFLSTSIISIFFSYFMNNLFFIIAPGIKDLYMQNLAVISSQISVFYLIFICLTSLFGAALNSNQKFFAFGIMPIIPNIIIASLLITTSYFNIQQTNLVILINISFLISGILQLIFIIYFASIQNIDLQVSIFKSFFMQQKENILSLDASKANLSDKFNTNVLLTKAIELHNLYKNLKMHFKAFKNNLFFDSNMQKFFKNFAIVSFSNLSMQINIFIGQAIASLVEGCIAILSYADRVYQLPISIISVTLNTILLPMFSSKESSIENKNNILTGVIIITMPVMLGLSAAAYLVTIFIYQRGAFSELDAIKTAKSLSYFAYSLPGFVLMRVIFSMFYAKQNTKLPAMMNFTFIIINIIFNLILINKFQHLAAPISNIIATYSVLFYLIFKAEQLQYISLNYAFIFNAIRCLIAALFMYFALNFLIDYYFLFILQSKVIILISIFCIVIIGCILYALSLILMWPQVLQFIKKKH